MRINVLISNPPYRRGSDLDFSGVALDINTDYFAVIVPAKWQTCDDDQKVLSTKLNYGQFREKVVPHMFKVVFYPDVSEVFPIRNVDGITYFICDNKVHDKCEVVNINLHQKYFNSTAIRDIRGRQSLHNVGQELIEYLGKYASFEFNHISASDRYRVCTGSQITSGLGWGYLDRDDPCGLINRQGKSKYVGTSRIEDNTGEFKSTNERIAEQVTFTSNSIEECNNFISWLSTKFVRFFIAINISKLNCVMCNDYFRFVPQPLLNSDNTYDFSKQYTDDMLYKRYGLYDESAKTVDGVRFIDIIESAVDIRD